MSKIKFTEEIVGNVSHNKSYPWKTKKVKPHYYTDGIIDKIPTEKEAALKIVETGEQTENVTIPDVSALQANFVPFLKQ